MLELILNNVSSKSFGIVLRERPVIPVPKEDVEQIYVRGRNDTLTRKYGWKDIDVPVKLSVWSKNIKTDMRLIKAWLLKATKLEISDEVGYYNINSVSVGDIENTFKKIGVFEVVFNCKPFFHKDVVLPVITVSGTKVTNQGTEKMYPKIKVTGSGTVNLSINGRGFTVIVTDYIEIDSELGYTYKGTVPQDDKVNGRLPYLDVGENTITWTGSVTKIEISGKANYL